MNSPGNLGREGIIAGREAQGRLKETPGAISIENSVAVNRPTHNLDSIEGSGTRMAGQEGHRALMLKNDPAEYQRTLNWMRNYVGDPDGWKIGTEYDKGGTMGGEVA